VRLPAILTAAGLALAGAGGWFAARAVGAGTGAAVTTTTVTLTGGPAGPRGPQGPTGPAGIECPTGFQPGDLVINHPGGQVTIFSCLR